MVQQEQCRPGLAPRQLGYPLSLRRQVRRVHAPSRVSRQRFSPRGASLSSFGSRRAQFPALIGTMKALRHPTRASTVAYWFAPAARVILLCSCLAKALPEGSKGSFQARSLVSRRPKLRLVLTWTRMGPLRSSGDPSRAFALFQDPGRADVPSPWRSRRSCPRYPDGEGLGRWLISGLTHSFGTRCPTLHAWRCRTRARLASGWPARPLPGGRRTPRIAMKGFSSFDDHPPFLLS